MGFNVASSIITSFQNLFCEPSLLEVLVPVIITSFFFGWLFFFFFSGFVFRVKSLHSKA